MSNWAGVWIGLWQGDWQGDNAAGGIVDAALIVTCTSTARFSPVDANAQQVGGSGSIRRLLYSSLLDRSVPVAAHLHTQAYSRARFAPIVAGVVPTALQGQGAGVVRLVAQTGQAVPAGLAGQGTSAAHAHAQLAHVAPAQLQTAHESTASFRPTITTRVVVVPIRARVELADDELAMILQLLAA